MVSLNQVAALYHFYVYNEINLHTYFYYLHTCYMKKYEIYLHTFNIYFSRLIDLS